MCAAVQQSSRGGRGDMLLQAGSSAASPDFSFGSSGSATAAATASRLQKRKTSSSSAAAASREQRRVSDQGRTDTDVCQMERKSLVRCGEPARAYSKLKLLYIHQLCTSAHLLDGQNLSSIRRCSTSPNLTFRPTWTTPPPSATCGRRRSPPPRPPG